MLLQPLSAADRTPKDCPSTSWVSSPNLPLYPQCHLLSWLRSHLLRQATLGSGWSPFSSFHITWSNSPNSRSRAVPHPCAGRWQMRHPFQGGDRYVIYEVTVYMNRPGHEDFSFLGPLLPTRHHQPQRLNPLGNSRYNLVFLSLLGTLASHQLPLGLGCVQVETSSYVCSRAPEM